MQLSDFTYELPEHLIASHPPKIRGTSRLLVLNRKNSTIEHALYSDLPKYLSKNDLVVRNNTEVIKARLHVTNQSGAARELLLLENHGGNDSLQHKVIYKGKLRPHDTLMLDEGSKITVEKILGNGEAIVSSATSFYELAERFGEVPLPPYMHRKANREDDLRYQTVFAQEAGSVAAPTASLNFTHKLEKQLIDKGIDLSELTLHVGLGTFLPIRTETLENHHMHSEYYVVPSSTISAISTTKNRGGRTLAVGTTVTRTLEHCAPQLETEQKTELRGEADIFIYPGYEFKTVDALLTNFHAPKSTVLMMAAAFAGWDKLLRAYHEAIKENYAFLSYGDSMLII